MLGTEVTNAIWRVKCMTSAPYRALRGAPGAPVSSAVLSSGHETIARHGADVMHFTRQMAFATSVPSIYQPHDLQHVHLPEFFTERERERRDREYRAFCAQAALVVAPTNWVRADLIEQYGLDPEKVVVVNQPPVTVAYEPPGVDESAAIAARLALPDRYLLYPAQTWVHKNHERLFEAIAALRAKGLRVPVVFSGRQTERFESLTALAHDLSIEDQLLFLGFVDTREVQVLYARAAGLIFPSLYEGWGMPVVEAFAAGIPVATSNVTSLPALAGDAAILFDPHDPSRIAEAIERLWSDGELAERLVERGRARARLFDWRHTALVLRAHYRRIAGRSLDAADHDRMAAPAAV
jgi:glycosyltransferase involved in cell wall biosynthesis